jgi:AcrR family transcriptional regulator
MAESARQRLLTAAGRLFGTQGINSTGIDRIIAEAGVAKASLYGNFSGKDELVEVYLQTRLDAWRGVVSRIAESSVKPATKIRRLFEATIPMEFYGCPFTNAIIEQPNNPGVLRVVAEYRRDLHDAVAIFIGQPVDHESVVAVVLILDGAVAAAKMRDPRITTDTALAVAVRNIKR